MAAAAAATFHRAGRICDCCAAAAALPVKSMRPSDGGARTVRLSCVKGESIFEFHFFILFFI